MSAAHAPASAFCAVDPNAPIAPPPLPAQPHSQSAAPLLQPPLPAQPHPSYTSSVAPSAAAPAAPAAAHPPAGDQQQQSPLRGSIAVAACSPPAPARLTLDHLSSSSAGPSSEPAPGAEKPPRKPLAAAVAEAATAAGVRTAPEGGEAKAVAEAMPAAEGTAASPAKAADVSVAAATPATRLEPDAAASLPSAGAPAAATAQPAAAAAAAAAAAGAAAGAGGQQRRLDMQVPDDKLSPEAVAGLAAFDKLLGGLEPSAESIGRASKHAVRLATHRGAPPRLMRAIAVAAKATEAAAQRKMHLFWLVDSIAQNASRELAKPGGTQANPGLRALVDAVEVRSWRVGRVGRGGWLGSRSPLSACCPAQRTNVCMPLGIVTQIQGSTHSWRLPVGEVRSRRQWVSPGLRQGSTATVC